MGLGTSCGTFKYSWKEEVKRKGEGGRVWKDRVGGLLSIGWTAAHGASTRSPGAKSCTTPKVEDTRALTMSQKDADEY